MDINCMIGELKIQDHLTNEPDVHYDLLSTSQVSFFF